MNTNTPETDAAEHDIDEIPAGPFVSCNFARKLERELNELAERLDFQEKLNRECLDQIAAITNELDEMTLRLERTNDSLFAERALADRLAEALNATRWDSPIACKSAFDTWKDERGLNWSKKTKNNEY